MFNIKFFTQKNMACAINALRTFKKIKAATLAQCLTHPLVPNLTPEKCLAQP
jgi:hypothetical protein